jgi:hypothetical protein
MAKDRNVYRVLMRKSQGNRPLGRPMGRWEDTIKISYRNRIRQHGFDSSG